MYQLFYIFNKKYCNICLSKINFNKLVITPCFHYFHKDCIIEWFKYNYSCPNCRKSIKYYNLLQK